MTRAAGVTVPTRLAALAAAVLAMLLYIGSLPSDFTFDDVHAIVNNPNVTGDGGIAPILTGHYWAGRSGSGALYRPLTALTYWLQFRVSGAEPWSYHLVNILLHGAVSALVLLLGLRMATPAAAGAMTILFAAHPIHTEAVASIVGRAELLAALFVLGAWLLRERPWTSAICFLLGMASKENAVILPVLLILEDALRRDLGPLGRLVRRYAPHLAALAVFLVIRTAVVGGIFVSLSGPFQDISTGHRLLTAVEVLGRYLWLMIWPVNLSADYSFNQIPIVTTPADPGFLAAAAAVAACLAAAWASRTRIPALSSGIGLYFVGLLPASNLLFGIGVIMAERLLYLPSVGWCLAVAVILERTLARAGTRRLIAACGVAAAVPAAFYAVRTWTRTADWRSQLTLFEATVRTSPRSALAHVNLGSTYQSLGRLEEAEASYRRSLAIAPDRPGAHLNLATILEQTGRRGEAIKMYREAVRVEPSDFQALNNLGRALLAEGHAREAIEVLERAVALVPGAPLPAGNLAAAYLESGDHDRAERLARQVLAAHPDDATARRVLEAVRAARNVAPGTTP